MLLAKLMNIDALNGIKKEKLMAKVTLKTA
jgi:hypothetical protein